MPEPLVSAASGEDPEYEALLSDAVGVALQVVLDTRAPAARVAFVLHDMFSVPFDEFATLLDRLAPGNTPAGQPGATTHPGDRARPGCRHRGTTHDRRGILRRIARRRPRRPGRGPRPRRRDPQPPPRAGDRTARRGTGRAGALQFSRFAPFVRAALINGAAGVVAFDREQSFALLAFTVQHGRAVAIDIFNDRELVPKLVRRAVAPSRHPDPSNLSADLPQQIEAQAQTTRSALLLAGR